MSEQELAHDNEIGLDDWIVIPNWDRFHLEGVYRPPGWIRLYTLLLHDPRFLKLSMASRGTLTVILLLYAENDGPLQIRELCEREPQVSWVQLERLVDAGFVEIRDVPGLAT